VNSISASATCHQFRAGGVALVEGLAVGIGFGNRVESGMKFLLVRAGASATMVAAARLSVSLYGGLQVSALAGFLATVALDVG